MSDLPIIPKRLGDWLGINGPDVWSENLERDCRLARDLGVRWVRGDVDLDNLDLTERWVETLVRHDLVPLALVQLPSDDFFIGAVWAAAVYRLVERCAGGLGGVELGNEPNGRISLVFTEGYQERGYQAAKAAAGSDPLMVLTAGTSQGPSEGTDRQMEWNDLMAKNVRHSYDGLAMHAYLYDVTPADRKALWNPQYQAEIVAYVTGQTRDRRRIHITESGYPAPPTRRYASNTPDDGEANLWDAMHADMKWWRDAIRAGWGGLYFLWWLGGQDPNPKTGVEATMGVYDPGGTPTVVAEVLRRSAFEELG